LPGSIAISLYRARFLQSYHDVMASMSVVVPPSMMKQLLTLRTWRIPIDGSKTRDASETEGASTIPAITTCNLLGLHGRVLEQGNERSVLRMQTQMHIQMDIRVGD